MAARPSRHRLSDPEGLNQTTHVGFDLVRRPLSRDTALEPITSAMLAGIAGCLGTLFALQGDRNRPVGNRAGAIMTVKSCARLSCWRMPRSMSSPATVRPRVGSASIAMSACASALRPRPAFRHGPPCSPIAICSGVSEASGSGSADAVPKDVQDKIIANRARCDCTASRSGICRCRIISAVRRSAGSRDRGC